MFVFCFFFFQKNFGRVTGTKQSYLSFLFSRTNTRQHFFMNHVDDWVDLSERALMCSYEDWEQKPLDHPSKYPRPKHEMNDWACFTLVTDIVDIELQRRKLDAMSNRSRGFLLMISPNNESICGKMFTWPDYLICQTR